MEFDGPAADVPGHREYRGCHDGHPEKHLGRAHQPVGHQLYPERVRNGLGTAGLCAVLQLDREPGSWQPIGLFSTLETVTISNIALTSAWPDGAKLYVLSVDDNANGTGDNWYGIDAVSFAPSTGGGYAAWALAQVPPVTGGVDGDSNNDGVQNGIAYFMGATGFITNPVLDASNKVTWPKSPTYNGTWQVQISSDLSAWTNVASTNDGSSISYTLETGLGKKFVRLLVTPTP